MKIAAIVGSLRKDSYNMKLAKTIGERYREKMNLELAEIRELPLFDQDDELNPAPAVREFKKQIAESDGVIFITPEYNWSVPGAVKNAIDWMSRVDRVLIGKPVMLAGVASGMMGTIRAQLHLREILAAPGISAKVLPAAGNELYINNALLKFDETSGRLNDEPTLLFLDQVIEKFISLVKAAGIH